MSLFKFWWVLIGFLNIDIEQIKAENEGGTCIFKDDFLLCKKDLPSLAYPVNISRLELRNIKWLELDLSDLVRKFPAATNITVHRGNISELLSPPPNNNIKVLNLHHVSVTKIDPQLFSNLTSLEILNLAYSVLPKLPNNIPVSSLKTIILTNTKWNCSNNLKWVLNLNNQITKDISSAVCHGEPYPEKSLVRVAQFLKDLKDQCPLECECTLPNIVSNPMTDILEPIIELNCSKRGLVEMPKILPAETKIIHLEGNDITDVSPLNDNPTYRSVLDMILDNNQISSIDVLEGSKWLRHFRKFSLSGNKLAEIPTYAIDNAFLQNDNMPHAVRLTLGENPWRCNCAFTPVFQEMLRKFSKQISDISEVKCSYIEGDENSLVPIIHLSRSSVCRYPSEYTVQALDLINAILASLIILVLAKLAYDYYHFRKTGRLPWIVTKMP